MFLDGNGITQTLNHSKIGNSQDLQTYLCKKSEREVTKWSSVLSTENFDPEKYWASQTICQSAGFCLTEVVLIIKLALFILRLQSH